MHDLWSARLTVIFFGKSPDREASHTQEKLGQNVLLLLLLLLHVTVLPQYGDCIHGESERALDPLSLSPNAAAQEDGVYYACVWPLMGFDRQSEQSETAAFAGV